MMMMIKGKDKTGKIKKNQNRHAITWVLAIQDCTFSWFNTIQLPTRKMILELIMHNQRNQNKGKVSRRDKETLTLMSSFFPLRYFPAPVTVPPVPMPATRAATFPSVAFQISGPVVS